MKCLADQEHLDKPSEPVEMSDVATKDINGNDFECDQCSFSTKTKWNLIQHQACYSYTVLHTVVFDYRNPEFLRELTLFDIDYARNVLNNR